MKNIAIVGLIILIFFVISFLTNILGPIIPDIINSFDLSLGLAGFLPFSFFLAYGIMSIPSGMLVEKYSEKKVMMAAFALAFGGALLFALFTSFAVAMLSLFLIGIGMAMLQVAINPLLRTAGGEDMFAFNSVLGQLFFGLASFVSPLLYSYLVTNIGSQSDNPIISTFDALVPAGMSWVSLYWVFAVISLIMVLIIAKARLPEVQFNEDEKSENLGVYLDMFKDKTVLLFFFGIVCYVGTEQGIANWMSQFLAMYHEVDPQTEGASAVSDFWGLLTLGCLLGLALLKVMDSKIVLALFAIAAKVCLALALFGSKDMALLCLPLSGFFLSVMWSVTISLGLNSVTTKHGALAGILCTGIAGGAIVPLIIGTLADIFSLRVGMLFLFVTLGYILLVAIMAKPIIKNKTIFSKDQLSAEG